MFETATFTEMTSFTDMLFLSSKNLTKSSQEAKWFGKVLP